jgi:GNAT superfamily N-acetyltransferase
MIPDLDIRPMRRQDLDTALGWAREEGWNPGLDDAGPFYAADLTGFLMGWLDDEPVGCISVVKYGLGFAFLGLYITRPEHRGKGYGKTIWDAGIASASGYTIGLDGVVAQQHNYRKSGFVLAHKSARWRGPTLARRRLGRRAVAVAPEHFDALLAFDHRHFPEDRRAFLDKWLQDSPLRKSAVVFDDGAVAGYGTIRQAIDGWKIGPLFAATAEIAGDLLSTLVTAADADSISIDIPEPNAAGIALAQSLGLTPSFETARMYLGPPPDLPIGHIFGITTLELG